MLWGNLIYDKEGITLGKKKEGNKVKSSPYIKIKREGISD